MKPVKDVHGGNVYEHSVFHDFSTSINPFPLPEEVHMAQKRAIESMRFYPDPNCSSLRKQLSLVIGTDHFVFGNGATELLYALMRLVPPNRKLLLFAPCFSEYENAANSCGLVTEKVYSADDAGEKPGKNDVGGKPNKNDAMENAFEFGINNKKQELFLSKMDASVGIVILCNPNNPTGKLYDPGFLKTVFERGKQYGIYVCVDECYGELVDEARYDASVRSSMKTYPNLLILRSFTKTYGLPGYRIGYLLCEKEETLLKIQSFLPAWNVSQDAQIVAAACLETVDLAKARREMEAEREFLREQLEDLKSVWNVYPSDTCFLMFHGEERLYEKLLHKGIMIRDLSGMEGLGPGYYRIGVRSREENQILIEAMKDCFDDGKESL